MNRHVELNERDIQISEFQDLLIKLIFDDSPPSPPMNRRQHNLVTSLWYKYKSQNQYYLTEIFKPNDCYEDYIKERSEAKIVNSKSPYTKPKDFIIEIDAAFIPNSSDMNS